MAAKPPEIPLDRGEFAEVYLRGAMRDKGGPGRITAWLERFFGFRMGESRWIVLTNKRLLVLRSREPQKYRTGDWFDVSLDRRRILASLPYLEGNLVVMPMVSGKGPATLLLPEGSFREAQRLARALGATGR